MIVGGGSRRLRARRAADRGRVDARARARGGAHGLLVGPLHPHAGGALVPDRQPLLRLEVRVGAGAVHERPPHLPRARQGARRLELDQRDDLPARQPARLRALGGRAGARATGTTRTACRTSSGWRPASRAPTSGAGETARCMLERGPAEGPLFDAFFDAVQEAGYPLTDDVNGYRQEGFAKFDRNIRNGRRAQRGARVPASGDEPAEPRGAHAHVRRARRLRRHARGRRAGRRARRSAHAR